MSPLSHSVMGIAETFLLFTRNSRLDMAVCTVNEEVLVRRGNLEAPTVFVGDVK